VIKCNQTRLGANPSQVSTLPRGLANRAWQAERARLVVRVFSDSSSSYLSPSSLACARATRARAGILLCSQGRANIRGWRGGVRHVVQRLRQQSMPRGKHLVRAHVDRVRARRLKPIRAIRTQDRLKCTLSSEGTCRVGRRN
jgi:hypothetical protein